MMDEGADMKLRVDVAKHILDRGFGRVKDVDDDAMSDPDVHTEIVIREIKVGDR